MAQTNQPAVKPDASLRITLRPATAGDESFLLQLYASTRDDLALLNWDERQKQALIKMQYDARRFQYDESYPQAEANIILFDGSPIGRLLIDESERYITLVDIALMQEKRNLGIGTELIRQLLNRAIATRKAVRLQVLKTNPALRLYQRLGFSLIAEQSMYYEMKFEK